MLSKFTLFALVAAVYLGTFIMEPNDHEVDASGKIRFNTLAKPKHPMWLAVINSMLKPFSRFLPSNGVDELLETAQARTGLKDFGNNYDLLREGLSELVGAIRKDTVLSPLGTVFIRELLLERLTAQLRLVDLVARYPEIHSEPIEAPLIIAGLPRTGTTNLHAIFAASGDFRFLSFYEGAHAFDVDINKSKTGAVDPRIEQSNNELWFLRAATPLMPLMVKISAETQVEEIYLESSIFVSELFETFLYIPTYGTWYETVNQDKVLAHLKLALQAMQFLDRMKAPDPAAFRPPRWVLKSPAHVSRIPSVLRVFPDARVVVTHRDPLPLVTSVCTLTVYMMRLYSDRISPRNMSWHWTHRLMGMIGTLLAHDAELEAKAAQILHVRAEDYWKDNVAMAQTIYKFLGMDMSEASLQRIASYVDANPRQGANAIVYSMDLLGLTNEEILQKYGDLRQRYVEKFLIGSP